MSNEAATTPAHTEMQELQIVLSLHVLILFHFFQTEENTILFSRLPVSASCLPCAASVTIQDSMMTATCAFVKSIALHLLFRSLLSLFVQLALQRRPFSEAKPQQISQKESALHPRTPKGRNNPHCSRPEVPFIGSCRCKSLEARTTISLKCPQFSTQ